MCKKFQLYIFRHEFEIINDNEINIFFIIYTIFNIFLLQKCFQYNCILQFNMQN